MTRTLGDAFVTIRPDMTGFGPALQRGVESPARSMSSRLGQFAKRAGIALGTAGVFGAAAFAKNAISLEQEFGRTMSKLQAATNTPAKGMQRLQGLALKMGAQTVFSANDASAAMLELARGGMNAATIQGGALQGTLTLAAAGELQMSESANVAVKAMGQFNLRGKDMKGVAAALAGGANASSASVRDMSIALAQGGLAANSVGFSIQETTGILAAFSNAGLEASDAGTSMKTFLDRLVPSTEKAEQAMRDLGLFTSKGGSAFVKANGEYKSAAQISEALKRATEDLSASERKKAISTIFGSDAQRAATIMSEEGAKGIRRMVKATSDQDAAQKMAQANMKGTAGAIEQMKGSMETASLAFGQAIKPLTIFAAGVVTEIANGAVPIFQELGGVIRRNLQGMDFSGITQAMKNIDVGAAFRSLRDIDLEGAGQGIRSIGQSIANADWSALRRGVGEGISDTVNVFAVAIGFLADHLDTLAKWMPAIIAAFVAFKTAQALNNVVSLASIPITVAQVGANIALATANRSLAAQLAILNNVERVSMIQRLRGVAVMIAQRTATLAVATATRVFAAGQWLLNAAMAANPLGLVVAALIALGVGLVYAYKKSETFRNIVNGAWAGIKAGAAAVADWFTGKFIPFFTDTIPAAFRSVINWVKRNWDVILAIITGPIGLAVLAVRRNWDRISNAFSAALDWVKGFFRSHWKTILAVLTGPIGLAVLAIHKNWDRITNFFSNALDWVRSTWSKNYAKVKGWITDPIEAARNGVQNILGRIREAFGNAVDGIAAAWGRLKGAAAAPVNFVIDTVYNKGIRAFVNGVLDKFGVDMQLPYALPLNWNRSTAGASTGQTGPGPSRFAAGGVFSGYTPGRDVHKFINPRTGQAIEASGGEAFMVPEWTKMVGGPAAVARMNKAARAGKMQFARGGVFWPVPGRDTSTYSGHDGVDINRGSGWDDFGDPIRAALSGMISYVGSGRGYGSAIFTKGSYGELVYGHTSRQNVRAGQFVDAGQLIGAVGNTGNSSAPHLHFGFPGGTYDAAMAVLRGAVPTGGGAGGGGGMMGMLVGRVVDWLADRGKGLLSKTPGQGSVFGKLAVGMGNKAIDAIANTITSRFGGAGGVTGDSTPVNANARLGRQLNSARGWGAMWPALNALVMSESGWRNTAQNPSSSAYGIGQFLDSTWGTVGGHKTSDARLQIQYMLRYIAQRYGNPASAWSFKQSHNWYGNGLSGGIFRHPTLIGVGERGPERVDVTPLNTARSAGLYAESPSLAARRNRQPVRMEGKLVISNWATGEAHFRGIARDEADAALDFEATTGRM